MRVLDWTVKQIPRPRVLNLIPAFTSGIVFGVHNSSLINVKRALVERVFRIPGKVDPTTGIPSLEKPPLPEEGSFHIYDRFVAEWKTHVGPAAISSVQEIVDDYKGPKRRSYSLAALTLRTRPLTKSDARLKAFVKSEKLNFTAKSDPCPRLIQPRSKRYNLVLGKYIKRNEKKYMRAIDRTFGQTVVLSGYNSFELGRIIASKWHRLEDPLILSFDFKRLDQHTSVEALQGEHKCYTEVFPESEELKEILTWQLKNVGIAQAKDGAIYYTVDGKRASGDINTSCGNKLIVCGLLWCYLVVHLELDPRKHFQLGNNGDDNFLMVVRPRMQEILDTLEDWFYARGYRLELEPVVDELEKLVFCQSSPICVDGTWRMVRTLNSIAKDSHTLLSIQSQADLEMWFAAVGQCGLALNQGVPVLQSFHNAFIRNSNGRQVSTDYLYKVVEYGNIERMGRIKIQCTDIADSTRLSFHKVFGVDPSRQRLLEQYYDELNVEYTPGIVKSTPAPYSVLHPNNFI